MFSTRIVPDLLLHDFSQKVLTNIWHYKPYIAIAYSKCLDPIQAQLITMNSYAFQTQVVQLKDWLPKKYLII